MNCSAPTGNSLSCLSTEDMHRLVSECAFFQRIFDTFPLLVALKSAKLDAMGQVLIWNQFAADLTGLSQADALGNRMDDLFPIDQREHNKNQDIEVLKHGKTLVIDEESLRARDGSTRWLRTTKTPIYDEKKRPLAILIVSDDITEKRKAQQALQSGRSILQEVLEHAPIGVLVKSLRPETLGRYLFWNQAMEGIFDVPASHVIGNHTVEHFDPLLASIMGESEVPGAQNRVVENPPIPAKLKSRNMIIRSFKARIDDADGKPLALVGIINGIYDSEKSASDLQETESRWQFAIAASNAGVWDWSAETGYVFLSNRMRELLRIPEDFICSGPDDLEQFINPADISRLREVMEKHLRGNEDIFRAEVRLNTPEEVWLVVNGKAQINPTGKPTRAIGTVADITPVKLAERQMALSKELAESANQAKGDFLAMMSHEIRTPLNGVLGFADLLAESKLNDQQREFLQTIRDSGGALLAILNDILDYSKIEAGKLDMDMKPTDVRQIGQSLVAFFHPQAEKKGIELRLQIHSSVPSLVLCDPVRVRQIILNLMGNALKFTSRGYVEFDLRASESRQPGFSDVCFYVRDSGIGISQTDQTRLFEPFNQLDASTARRFGGTGLGLSIVKRLAELMGGSVRVESEVGAGTTFYVTLPCQLVQDDYDPRKTMLIQLDITTDFAKSRPLRILVAEDNLVNRKLARLLLQKFGYAPDEAEDGSRAVAMALENTYDLILMDIQMPGMDGYEAAQRIREMCKTPPQIVALTAHALKTDEVRSREQGMDGHLSKPIRADLLRKVLEKASRAMTSKRPPAS